MLTSNAGAAPVGLTAYEQGRRQLAASITGQWRDSRGQAAQLSRLLRADAVHRPLLSAMHADRKSVFIDTLGWDLASPDGLHEIDAYDRDDTLYLVVHGAGAAQHLGSVRLLPSTGPHLLGDLFPGLCAAGVPCGDDVWEITRLVTSPALPRGEALQVRRQLALGLFSHGLAHGIRRYTMMTHMAWLSGLLALGWDAEPLGLPQRIAGADVAAMQIHVDAATHARLAAEWGLAAAGPAPPPAIPIGPGADLAF